jgi:hypothetical protein
MPKARIVPNLNTYLFTTFNAQLKSNELLLLYVHYQTTNEQSTIENV